MRRAFPLTIAFLLAIGAALIGQNLLPQTEWTGIGIGYFSVAVVAFLLVLVSQSSLSRALCAEPVTWVIARESTARSYPFLEHMHKVEGKGYASGWKATAAMMGAMGLCPETPTGDSKNK